MASKKYPSVRPENGDSRLQANVNYGTPTDRDKWLQLFQGPGGTLKHIKDPEMKKLILKRGAIRA